ncbi:hypothetical protein BKH45_07905 [Helicobacter sp. 11S03491-1]|nr:hypothetical protein BKH45_07905 [Helicobacter sp. 11S03491-1]
MFSRLIRNFFSNVFIGVNVDSKICSLKVMRIKDGKVIEDFNREFKTIDNEVSMDAIKLIRSYQEKYPFTYLSAMSKNYNQGIINKEKKEDLSKYGINPKECNILDFNTWKVYIKNSAIQENAARFSKINGIDFLFSPFIVIYHRIKNKIGSKTSLYVLQERSSVSLLVADLEGIYFGGYFMVEGEVEDMEIEQESLEKKDFHTDLPTMDYKDEDLDDEIDDLVDLDSEFFIDKLNEKLLLDNQEEDSSKDKVNDLTKISIVSNIIQNSLREFYSNELYESKFIEEIVILDAYGISDGALNYLGENTMIETSKISVCIVDELVGLSKIEFKKGNL